MPETLDFTGLLHLLMINPYVEVSDSGKRLNCVLASLMMGLEQRI